MARLSFPEFVNAFGGVPLEVAQRAEQLSKSFYDERGPARTKRDYESKLETIAAGVGPEHAAVYVTHEVMVAIDDSPESLALVTSWIDQWLARAVMASDRAEVLS